MWAVHVLHHFLQRGGELVQKMSISAVWQRLCVRGDQGRFAGLVLNAEGVHLHAVKSVAAWVDAGKRL